MRDFIIQMVAFAITMFIAYRGERKTKVDAARDKKEFEGRISVIGVALILFIVLEVLIRLFLFLVEV